MSLTKSEMQASRSATPSAAGTLIRSSSLGDGSGFPAPAGPSTKKQSAKSGLPRMHSLGSETSSVVSEKVCGTRHSRFFLCEHLLRPTLLDLQ